MSAVNKVCFKWQLIILFLKLAEHEAEAVLERNKVEPGGNLSAPKEQNKKIICHKALFQSFPSLLTLIIHSDCRIIM